MKISPDSWHYKLYVFMCQWNAAWLGRDDHWEYPRKGTMIGLCPYMRMILIWGPLAILSNLIPIGAVIATFFIFPAAANGIVGIAWIFGFFILLGFTILIIGYISHLQEYVKEKRRTSQILKNEKETHDSEPHQSFLGLVWSYIIAVKTRMCPVLELSEDD